MNNFDLTDCRVNGTSVFTSNSKGNKQDGLRGVGDHSNDHRKPLITVITVVFNGASTLEKSISSVIRNLNDDVEYIIIDGGSVDGTLEIIRRYENQIDSWISEADRGIYDAWNKGIALARGEWISFLGADDCYQDGALKAYANFIHCHSNESFDYISSRINLISDGNCFRTVGKRWNWKDFKKYMNVAHVGSMHNRTLFAKHGLYDISYKICGDYEFLLRPGIDLKAGYMNAITVDMSVGGVSNGSLLAFEETRRAKLITGKRGFIAISFEKYIAIIKWKIRGWIQR